MYTYKQLALTTNNAIADNPNRTIILPTYKGCSFMTSGLENLSKKETLIKQ